MNSYRIDPAILPCALSHIEPESIASCDQCKEQAEKIEKALQLWREWPKFREVVKKNGLLNKITTLDLEYKDGDFVVRKNYPLLKEHVTPQSIIFGYSEKARSPFLLIRYFDARHDARQNVPFAVKSYLTITLENTPLQDKEEYLIETRYFKNGAGGDFQASRSFRHDGGHKVRKYVVKLLKGKLDGKVVL